MTDHELNAIWTRKAQAVLARTRQRYPWTLDLRAEAAPDAGADGGEGGEGGAPAADAKPKGKTWTPPASQAELDAIVNKAKIQARKEFADYGDLKVKAEEYDKLQESTKTNEEKLRTNYERAVRDRDAALTRAQNTLVRAAIISAASKLGVVDPDAVAALLPKEDLVIEGDEVLGVSEAVQLLLKNKPYLRSTGAQRAGNELVGGGSEPPVFTRSQLRQWLATGQMTKERQAQVDEAAKAGRIVDR